MADRVLIFDTTLRDGEQSPGISLDVGEKLELAAHLADLGVDIIEAGFPAASDGDFESVRSIARGVSGPVIAGLTRTAFADIDRAWDALSAAPRARLHVFIATSAIHMEKKLGMTREQVLAEAKAGVERARSWCDDVEFSAEDASRSDRDFLCEVLQGAVDRGATTLNIPDTVGFAVPDEYKALICYVRENVRGDYVLSTHCHDDLGLAVANSLAGVAGGARQVECAINGLGERAGNAALEEVVMALKTRSEQFAGLETGVRTTELARTSRLVSRLTGYPVQYNKAVVGRNAFAHEAGIHQHGVLNDPSTYEIMDAAAVGQEAAHIVLGKHSGRHAFADVLARMGYRLHGEALNEAFVQFKALADRKIQVTDGDLEALATERLRAEPDRYELVSLEVHGGTVAMPRATVVVADEARLCCATSEGVGMIDAATAAISIATGIGGTVRDLKVSAVTAGGDALADVVIEVEFDATRSSGRGVATDVVEATARAFINASNRTNRRSARLASSG
jgi:2-isopropylmalate synthase